LPSVAPPPTFSPSQRAGALCSLGFPGRWSASRLARSPLSPPFVDLGRLST
jgi:hypothetical protein